MDKKINLLFVDDEEQFLLSLGKQLQARGFNVTAVNRGEKAIEVARENPIDIALVDLKMPGINGEETLRGLKSVNEWIEIIILTGHGSIDSETECTRRGAYSYLQKPCRIEDLMNVLIDAFKKKVMSRNSIKEVKMDEMLKDSESPLAILRRLKEIDKEGAPRA